MKILDSSSFAGLLVHGYRDTTTLNPRVLGNDLPLSIMNEFHYSSELGINLFSAVDNPQMGCFLASLAASRIRNV
jgi:hypothetical protein